MSKFIIANWKAHPDTSEDAKSLFEFEIAEAAKYSNVRTVICPPAMFLKELAKMRHETSDKGQAQMGSQDVFWDESEIFEPQKLGINYVLVGHSSRRYPPTGEGENDVVINKKIKAALLADIIPILLVGEREKSDDRKLVLSEQLMADLLGLTKEEISKILIAYEPVWAISTNPNAEADTPEKTLEAIGIINEILSKTYNLKPITYLYGGSVNSNNIASFLSYPEISGAVIGAASLRKEEFAKMLEISVAL
jgi:triosephosphate isomerase (TIM)